MKVYLLLITLLFIAGCTATTTPNGHGVVHAHDDKVALLKLVNATSVPASYGVEYDFSYYRHVEIRDRERFEVHNDTITFFNKNNSLFGIGPQSLCYEVRGAGKDECVCKNLSSDKEVSVSPVEPCSKMTDLESLPRMETILAQLKKEIPSWNNVIRDGDCFTATRVAEKTSYYGVCFNGSSFVWFAEKSTPTNYWGTTEISWHVLPLPVERFDKNAVLRNKPSQ